MVLLIQIVKKLCNKCFNCVLIKYMYVILLMKSTSEYNKNFRGSNFRSTSILKPFDVLGEIQTKRTVRDKNNSREIGESVFSS